MLGHEEYLQTKPGKFVNSSFSLLFCSPSLFKWHFSCPECFCQNLSPECRRHKMAAWCYSVLESAAQWEFTCTVVRCIHAAGHLHRGGRWENAHRTNFCDRHLYLYICLILSWQTAILASVNMKIITTCAAVDTYWEKKHPFSNVIF